jgi:hypothetical protein
MTEEMRVLRTVVEETPVTDLLRIIIGFAAKPLMDRGSKMLGASLKFDPVSTARKSNATSFATIFCPLHDDRTAALGQEDQFSRPRLNGRYR